MQLKFDYTPKPISIQCDPENLVVWPHAKYQFCNARTCRNCYCKCDQITKFSGSHCIWRSFIHRVKKALVNRKKIFTLIFTSILEEYCKGNITGRVKITLGVL